MRAVTAVLVLGLLASPVSAQQDEAARLYDEARALVEQAEAAESAADALLLLDRARANLDAIVGQHPASEAASRLVLGDPLERRLNVALAVARERAETERAESETRTQSCVDQPTANCLFDVALATARSIEDAGLHPGALRASALRAIAAAQAEAGQFDAALATARDIEDAGKRTWAQSQIAAAQAKAGMFDAALALARNIEDPRYRAGTLEAIVIAQAEAGQLDYALATAQEVWNAGFRVRALVATGRAQATAGEIDAAILSLDAALATARDIVDEREREGALKVVAIAWAEVGKFDSALTTVGDIWDGVEEARALAEIAIAQAEAGQVDAALATAHGIRHSSFRPDALAGKARVQAKADDLDAALIIVDGIEGAEPRADALARMAVDQAEAGQVDVAMRLFDTASTSAREIDDAPFRYWALEAIARRQADAGLFDAALATILAIRDDVGPNELRFADFVLASVYSRMAVILSVRAETEIQHAERSFPLLSQKSPANYRDPTFRDLSSTTAAGERPVWQLACLATVYAMLERGRGNADAMIDDWFADPRENGGSSPGALRPTYVGDDVALDTTRITAELNAGRPVILRAVGGPLGQHFVLAIGIEEGTVTTLDPWPGQNAPDDAPGQGLRIPLGDGRPAHPLIPGLVFTDMRLVAD